MQQDEIYLIDMWRIVRRRWPWMAGVALATVAATVGWLHMARGQWEAVAAIQVGQIGTAPQGMDPKVEPFARVLQRLQSAAFQGEVLKDIGLSEASNEARLYHASLTLDPDPYANIIRMHVRAYSPEDARQLAVATANRLAAIHESIGRAQLDVARMRSDDVDKTLAEAESDRERLAKEMVGASHDDAMVVSMALANADGGVRMLKQMRGELAARMTSSYTFPTSMAWPVTVSGGPVAPAKTPLLAIGVLGGLVFGVAAATAVDALSRSTKRVPRGTYAADARRGGERYEPAANPGDVNAA